MAEIILNHAPFVASEVGLKLETRTVDTTKCGYVTENGKTVVKAGSVYADSTNNVYGLVYRDIELASTSDSKMASIMTGGYYVAANLPTGEAAKITASSNAVGKKFVEHGLFAQTFEDIIIGDPENA